MGIASAMKELTQDIASSHKDRAKRVGEIKEETKQARTGARGLIKSFQSSRKELRAEIKEASAAWQGVKVCKSKKRKED